MNKGIQVQLRRGQIRSPGIIKIRSGGVEWEWLEGVERLDPRVVRRFKGRAERSPVVHSILCKPPDRNRCAPQDYIAGLSIPDPNRLVR